MKIAQDLFTGADNETFDVARILWTLCVVALIAFTAYSLYRGDRFDVASFAGGCAALLFGGGAGVWVKRETEPLRSTQKNNLGETVGQIEGEILK